MSYISDHYKIPPNTVVQMSKDGILDWRVNVLYEFYTLYAEVLNQNMSRGIHCPRGDAREEVMMHFRITERTFYYWLSAAKRQFENDIANMID